MDSETVTRTVTRTHCSSYVSVSAPLSFLGYSGHIAETLRARALVNNKYRKRKESCIRETGPAEKPRHFYKLLLSSNSSRARASACA